MPIIDEIEKTERGIATARAAAPGIGGVPQIAVGRPRAAVSAQPGQQSVGTRIGAGIRRAIPAVQATGITAVNTPIRQAETAINVASAVPRRLGGVARDAAAAVGGQPAANQGQPLAGISLPKVGVPSNPAAQGVAPAIGTGQPANYSPGPSVRTRTIPPKVPAGAPPAAQPIALQPGDPNTFTGSDGLTKAVPGLLNSTSAAAPAPGARTLPGIIAAPRNMAPEARAASIETQRDITNNATGASEVVGASALNGLSPQSELMRRFEISQGGFKGSPSARRMAGEAILGTIGQMNGATVAGASGASQAALAGQEDQVAGNENFARRRFDASKFNVESTLANQALDAKARTPYERQPIVRGLDGSTNVLRVDGTLTKLSNQDGTPFRLLDPQQPTTVSPDTEYKALTDELTALSQLPTEESRARAAEIRARMQELSGKGARVAPAVGSIQNGYRYRGGDPSRAESWEKTN